jgi:aryl-alcohol dehydrogenase-like predicted oxidoreductase
MRTAYENGVNFFDNAEAYAGGRSETVMGNILKKSGWAHETFLVSSKVFWGGHIPNSEGLSRKHVIEACHAALRRLQVDYLDFYFCHRPDPETPIEETTRAMSDLVHQEYARLYDEYGLGTTTWSPLASGLLTGKHKGGPLAGTRATLKDYEWLKDQITRDMKEKGEKVAKLDALAKELGLPLAVFSIAWCLKNPHVSTVILGASKVEQLSENLRAVEAQTQLTPDVMKQIDEIVGV